MTVNSFTSVSLDPPLVLVCLDKNSGALDSFVTGAGFCINILRESQQYISNDFASKLEDRFSVHSHTTDSWGNPILDDCLSYLECQREAVHEGGDHLILVGRVTSFHYEANGDPLIYFRGGYRELRGV